MMSLKPLPVLTLLAIATVAVVMASQEQGDQIGRVFACRAIVYFIQFF
jgi:hypothetical protein